MSTREIFDFRITSHFTRDELIEINHIRDRYHTEYHRALLAADENLYKRVMEYKQNCIKFRDLVM